MSTTSALAGLTALIALIALPACLGNDRSAARLPLQVVADLPLPGDTSRLDYASLDASRHLLFIAHLGASEVLAVDTGSRKVVARIAGIRHVHGVLSIPELGRVYASATGTDEIVAIDVASMSVTARMPGGFYPDGMAYVPALQKLYVSDEHGASETVIDVQSNRRVTTIPLGGDVGNSQYDPVSGHVFVNVQSRGQLIEIDPAIDRIVQRTDLPGAEGNHGLQILGSRRLAAIACEDNHVLLILDLETHRVTQSFQVGSEPDVLAYDEARALLYVASESGVASVFKVGAGGIDKIAEGHAGPNAHVVAVDPASHLVYFPIADLDGHPVLRIFQPPK